MPEGFPEIGIWQSRHSLMVLDVAGGSLDDGAPIHQWDMHGGDMQRFRIEPLGGGQFALRAVHSGKVLDVSDWSTDRGARIQQYDWHGGNNQLWQIVIPSARPGPRPGDAVPFD
jgi:ricin-type beta-trefoil lectin protein